MLFVSPEGKLTNLSANYYTETATEGEKYQETKITDITTIAKLVREQLKKEFPHCKFSVTSERAGGHSLYIALVSANFEAITNFYEWDHLTDTPKILNLPQKHHAQINHYTLREDYEAGLNNGTILSKEAWDVMKQVAEIATSYNYDDSDSMTDYFRCNFFLNLEIGKWNKPFTKHS